MVLVQFTEVEVIELPLVAGATHPSVAVLDGGGVDGGGALMVVDSASIALDWHAQRRTKIDINTYEAQRREKQLRRQQSGRRFQRLTRAVRKRILRRNGIETSDIESEDDERVVRKKTAGTTIVTKHFLNSFSNDRFSSEPTTKTTVDVAPRVPQRGGRLPPGVETRQGPHRPRSALGRGVRHVIQNKVAKVRRRGRRPGRRLHIRPTSHSEDAPLERSENYEASISESFGSEERQKELEQDQQRGDEGRNDVRLVQRRRTFDPNSDSESSLNDLNDEDHASSDVPLPLDGRNEQEVNNHQGRRDGGEDTTKQRHECSSEKEDNANPHDWWTSMSGVTGFGDIQAAFTDSQSQVPLSGSSILCVDAWTGAADDWLDGMLCGSRQAVDNICATIPLRAEAPKEKHTKPTVLMEEAEMAKRPKDDTDKLWQSAFFRTTTASRGRSHLRMVPGGMTRRVSSWADTAHALDRQQ